jgi:hypothetical protein
MRFRRSARTIALALLLGALSTSVSLGAGRTICIVGNGTGAGWSWGLRDGTSSCQQNSVAGVVGSAQQVAQRFVDSINGNCSAGGPGDLPATARILEPTDQEFMEFCTGLPFEVGFLVSGGDPTPLSLFVGASGIDPFIGGTECPEAPSTCNFNPDAAGAPALSNNFTAAIPALQPWHYVAITLLIVAVGAFFMWRRPGV